MTIICGRVAAGGRVDGGAGLDAEPPGQVGAGVRVPAGHALDDRDRVDGQRRADVGERGAGRLGHEVDGLERGGRVGEPLLGLTDADDDGGAGIDGHTVGGLYGFPDRHSAPGPSSGTGQTGAPGAAESGQIERYAQVRHASASETPMKDRSAAACRMSSTTARELRVDPREVLGVGLEVDRIRPGVRTEVLVADADAAPRGERHREPRLHAGAGVLGEVGRQDPAGLVVAHVEEVVVLPDRVEPSGADPHRPVARDAHDVELVTACGGPW